ncbi:hypothetical protein ACO0QE_000770 [Hanseniaspora vineae]
MLHRETLNFELDLSSYQPRLLQSNTHLITDIQKLANVLRTPDYLYLQSLSHKNIISTDKSTGSIIYNHSSNDFNSNSTSSANLSQSSVYTVESLDHLQEQLVYIERLLNIEQMEYENVSHMIDEKFKEIGMIRFQNNVEIQSYYQRLNQEKNEMELHNLKLQHEIYKKQLRLRDLNYIRNELLTFDFEKRMGI